MYNYVCPRDVLNNNVLLPLVFFQTFCTCKRMLCRINVSFFCYLLVDSPSSTNLITVPNKTTFLRGSNISLDCSTDASPDAHIYQFFLNYNLIGSSSSVVFKTTVMADGIFTCVPVNTVGTGDNATVSITVVGELQ